MAGELYDNLMEMYNSFFSESQEIKKKLNDNLNTIAEIDLYLEKLCERDETDYKIFSPRSIREVYKEDIDAKRNEKTTIENENQNYYKLINRMDSRIETLFSVLNAMEHNEQNQFEELLVNGSKEKETQEKKFSENDIEKKLHMLDVQEKERQRIARDLHDSSLQNLAHLTHKIELASMYMEQDMIKARLELAAVNKDLKMVIQEIRNTIFDLRPMSFDDLGLKESLERLADKLKESSTFEIETDIENIVCDNSLVLMTIYRITEECMNNAIKHSSGNYVLLSVKKMGDHSCFITVTDNGHGFNSDQIPSGEDRHFGLCILRERVSLLSGSMDIESVLEKGTTVKIKIPV